MATARPRAEKILLVSKDYTKSTLKKSQFREIAQFADSLGCTTICYALYTFNRKATGKRLKHADLFRGTRHVTTQIFESGNFDLPDEEWKQMEMTTELWQRDQSLPRVLTRKFATSNEHPSRKQKFVDELAAGKRTFNRNQSLWICGESSGIFKLSHDGKKTLTDEFRVLDIVERLRVATIYNPLHTYQVRWECAEKRRVLSRGRRHVISVWNYNGAVREPKVPWSFHCDGAVHTERIQEISGPLGRIGLRFGLLCLRTD